MIPALAPSRVALVTISRPYMIIPNSMIPRRIVKSTGNRSAMTVHVEVRSASKNVNVSSAAFSIVHPISPAAIDAIVLTRIQNHRSSRFGRRMAAAKMSADASRSPTATAPASLLNATTVGTPSTTVTSENGTTATFTLVLNSQPTANVTIPVSSTDLTEGTVSPGSVIFTSANWNVPQTVTVTGVDDPVADGDVAYMIQLTAASGDASYAGIGGTVLVVNTDNDVAGITVSTPSTTVTSEAGTTATFTVVLTSQPTADVTVPISSSDTTEGTVSPASVTFTAGTWNLPQTVTVTGVDDLVADGTQSYQVVFGPVSSGDPAYNGKAIAPLAFTNTDNDAVGITVGTPSSTSTSESGTTATFTLVLNSQPTADVTIQLSSTDTTEGTVSPAAVVFTSANWNAPQTVTVTGVDDQVADGPQTYQIVIGPVSSGDTAYNGLALAPLTFTNADNDAAGIVVSAPSTSITSEAGTTATFTIVLTSQPTADVTIQLSSSDTTEGTVSPSSVVFTAANWNAPQTVTVTGVDDSVNDGNVGYWISEFHLDGLRLDAVQTIHDDSQDHIVAEVTRSARKAAGTRSIILVAEDDAAVAKLYAAYAQSRGHTVLFASDGAETLVVAATELPPRDKERLRFAVRQWLDALAPSNFFWTNPEVLKATADQRGANLLRGAQNFQEDWHRTATGKRPAGAERSADAGSGPSRLRFGLGQ